MVRPTLIDNLSERKRVLGANMCARNEDWELIAKYMGLEDTVSLRKSMQLLADELVQPLSTALYLMNIELAQTGHVINVAMDKAEEGSGRHMSEYAKLSTHSMKLIRQLDELEELEEAKGRSWEPIFDTESEEFRVFAAAAELQLARGTHAENDFDTLTQDEQDRFLKLMAEGG